jgi:hypothetical protein
MGLTLSYYATLVVWPAYPIDSCSKFGIIGVGHAGAILLDGTTGATSYNKYRRYYG